MKTTGEERFRCVVVWMLLVIIILLSILCFSGCTRKMYRHKEWDTQGNLIGKVDVTLVSCLTKTQAKNIFVITDKRMLFVGDLSQIPDVQSIKALAEVVSPLWMKVLLP